MRHRSRKTLDEDFAETIVSMLKPAGAILWRPMFGGYGFYLDGIFFAILYKGVFYMKASGEAESYYKDRGMSTFRPNAKQHLKSYYEVPPEALEDSLELMRLLRLSTG